MKIDKLKIDGFGKIADREIEFKDGYNIVYGMNEAGKSTLQMFILTMLYGRPFSDELKKFKPWQEEVSSFGGAIDYRIGKEAYEIRRNLSTEDLEASVKVLDRSAGKDITKNYYTEGNNMQVMEKQIGISQRNLINSVFLKQADTVNVENLGEIFNKRLKNLSESGEEDVSITQAVQWLEKFKGHIGEYDKGNAKRGNVYSRLMQNKSRLEEIIKLEKEVFLIQDEYEKKLEQANKLREDIIGRERLLQIAKAGINKTNYEIGSTSEEDVRGRISTFVGEEKFQIQEKLKREYQKYTTLIKKQADLKNEINAMGELLNSLRSKLKDVDKEKLNAVEINYINLCNEIATCKQQIQASEVLVKDKNKILLEVLKLQQFKKYSIVAAMMVIIVLSTVLGLYNPLGFFGYLGAAFCCFEYFMLKVKCTTERKNIADEIEGIHGKKGYNTEVLKLKEKEYEKLCNDIGGEPDEIFEKIKILRKLYQKEAESELKLRKATLNLNAVQTELEYEYKNISEIIKNYCGISVNSNNFDNIINNLINEIVNNDERKGNNSAQKIINTSEGIAVPTLSELDNLKNKLKKLEQESEIINEKICVKLERINMYGVKQEITERIRLCEIEYEEIKDKFKAADFAIKELMLSGKRVGEEYGRLLVSKISNRLNTITNGKYNHINIDENMNITALDEENKVIRIDNLSSSIIDQFNFSYRVSMAEVMSGNRYHLPLILDEPFEKYDDKRLEEAINVLFSMSKNYQIILFTCQKRDIDVTRAICQQKFNLVCL